MTDGVLALEAGAAFVDLSSWRTVAVVGSDSVTWLNDLVTNRVDDLADGVVRRTLFLDRTGHVRADVVVVRAPEERGLVLVQDPVQDPPIDRLLDPYVLSSDVRLDDRTGDLGVVAMPAGHDAAGLLRLHGALGEAGDSERRAQIHSSAEPTLQEATLQDLEIARIRAGLPRFGVDLDDGWLPSEAALDDLIDATKGCFLGQESVARVRNLGHPPRLVLPFHAEGHVFPMAPITAGGEDVGRVTSVAPLDDGDRTACIGWVRWDARDAELSTTDGFPFRVRSDHSA